MLLYLIHEFFFKIALSAADIAADAWNSVKVLLVNGVSIILINIKTAFINGQRQLRIPP